MVHQAVRDNLKSIFLTNNNYIYYYGNSNKKTGKNRQNGKLRIS